MIFGGLIALTAAIFGIFYKDTVNKDTNKLTKWGLTALIFLLFGAAINSSSKFYDFKKERQVSARRDSVQHVQDSLRDLQLDKLQKLTFSLDTLKDTSIASYEATSKSFRESLDKLKDVNKGVEESFNSINPIFPLTIKYGLAIDLTNESAKDFLTFLQSNSNDILLLTDKELRKLLSDFNNKPLNTIFTQGSSIADYKIFFVKNEKTEIQYFCRRTKSQLSIQKSETNNHYYFVDESEYYISSKPLGVTDIKNSTQLRDKNMSLVLYRYYVPEIPQDLYPTIWSDMEIQLAKQTPFIIKKKRRASWRDLDFSVTPHFLVKGQTTLEYKIEDWDKLEDDY
ncbi:MAG: hypothetical protein QM768_01930 [Agriterribacter sp.]